MSTPTDQQELPKQYHHAGPEERWYAFWEERKYFHSEPDPKRKPYTIVIPPPNVTGALHLGHALNDSLQDILIRSKRMQGFNTLWMPGTDHAGIATQAVVERRILEEEKKSRHDLGREKLVERIWEWKNEYERRILGQFKRMGFSCDWDPTRFTLDEGCTRAVRHTFFSFFKEGLIYRGRRLVNWDTFLQTAVSDDEVNQEKIKGHFWHLKYPVREPQDGEPRFVTIATTRPETMLGDTAVAVHPDPAAAFEKVEAELRAKLAEASEKHRPAVQAELDDLAERRTTLLPGLIQLRDMALAGRSVLLPLVAREIPLVADSWAKPEMGSGCVKITPAHDPNDYEVGVRQRLPMINIMNPDGTLNGNAGAYSGAKIMQARERVVADMEALGLLVEVEDREVDIPVSDRSKTPIEPLLADQWFVRMQDLAQSAMDAVTDGRVKIFPSRYAAGYLDWLGEKRDWPISRQLWWGHQIPIWYAAGVHENALKKAFAGRDDVVWTRDPEHDRWLVCAQETDLAEDAIPNCKLVRDPDVLDTWFSSALWPHSTMGWPDKTPELDYYYPTSALVTSREIMTLWVARMVLTGLHNMREIPFRDVFIHPTILDGYGERMSKSKGNGVDPLDIIDKFGADALRYGLADLTTETQDVRLPVDFECPNCGAMVEQTKKNRVLPRVPCKQCGQDFATQWAKSAEDVALLRATVVSERFEKGRNFCNKLWNATRFALLNLEGYTPGPVADAELTNEDRWILSRLNTVAEQVTAALDTYRFADATRVLYGFAWDEFCSFYLEMIKGRLQEPATRPAAQRVLAHTLDSLVRLLHPIIPFITEEIWQLLAHAATVRGLPTPTAAAESVMIAPWPTVDKSRQDSESEARFARFQDMLAGLREIRSRQNIPPKTEISFSLKTDEATARLLEPMAPYFESMAKARGVAWGPQATAPATSANVNVSAGELFVDLTGLIDVPAEISRNEKERDRLAGSIAGKKKKLENASFVERAPPDVVATERRSLAEQEERLAQIEATLEALKK